MPALPVIYINLKTEYYNSAYLLITVHFGFEWPVLRNAQIF